MALEKEELMEKIKNELRPELTKISFDTWINPLDIRSIDGNHIVFTTVSEFQRDFVENKYKPLLLNTLKFITNRDWEYTVIDLEKEAKEEQGQNKVASNANLQVLRLDKEGMVPNFESGIYQYYLTVPTTIEKIEVLAIAENPNATVQITGNENLKEGFNIIKVQVLSEDKTRQQYLYD